MYTKNFSNDITQTETNESNHQLDLRKGKVAKWCRKGLTSIGLLYHIFFQDKSIYGQRRLQDVLVHMICLIRAVHVASVMAANADTLIPSVVHNVDQSSTAIIVSNLQIVFLFAIKRYYNTYGDTIIELYIDLTKLNSEN